MDAKKIKLFADCHCELSESPIWNAKDQMLYWRGFSGEIYRKTYHSPPGEYECFPLQIGPIGSIILTSRDTFLLFADEGKIWEWAPYQSPVLYKDCKKSLFNDCMVDSKNRIFCGMLADNFFDAEKRGKHGSLWRLDPDGNFLCLEDSVGDTPNGIRFSPDHKKMYFAVTDEDKIYQYDYDPTTGEIKNRSVFAANCFPDGIATDKDGNLWVANCRPGKPLLCYNAAGTLIQEYFFPAYRLTSLCFGGPTCDTIFVTTASESRTAHAHDGGIFMIENIAQGSTEYRFSL